MGRRRRTTMIVVGSSTVQIQVEPKFARRALRFHPRFFLQPAAPEHIRFVGKRKWMMMRRRRMVVVAVGSRSVTRVSIVSRTATVVAATVVVVSHHPNWTATDPRARQSKCEWRQFRPGAVRPSRAVDQSPAAYRGGGGGGWRVTTSPVSMSWAASSAMAAAAVVPWVVLVVVVSAYLVVVVQDFFVKQNDAVVVVVEIVVVRVGPVRGAPHGPPGGVQPRRPQRVRPEGRGQRRRGLLQGGLGASATRLGQDRVHHRALVQAGRVRGQQGAVGGQQAPGANEADIGSTTTASAAASAAAATSIAAVARRRRRQAPQHGLFERPDRIVLQHRHGHEAVRSRRRRLPLLRADDS